MIVHKGEIVRVPQDPSPPVGDGHILIMKARVSFDQSQVTQEYLQVQHAQARLQGLDPDMLRSYRRDLVQTGRLPGHPFGDWLEAQGYVRRAPLLCSVPNASSWNYCPQTRPAPCRRCAHTIPWYSSPTNSGDPDDNHE